MWRAESCEVGVRQNDHLTIGMLSHHHPVVVPVGKTPAATLEAAEAEMAMIPSDGASYEWLRADPEWRDHFPAVTESPLYVNYLPRVSSGKLRDETWRLEQPRQQRQKIAGLGLVISPTVDGLQVTAHHNEPQWPASAVDQFLDDLPRVLAEMRGT